MIELKGTSWQQRYSMKEIFTLQCRILDKPAVMTKLCDIIGKTGSFISDIKLIGAEDQYLLRDVTIFSPDKEQLEKIARQAESTGNIRILNIRNETLQTHNRGSIEVISRMPIKSLTDLRMVYTPGVAEVCETIQNDPVKVWELTGVCDRVAIVTNGTAVLGLGDIGVLGALPVMEGKASIMAEFVNISAFPILIDSKDPDIFVETVVRIASGFGAIQMEDVAAPECFEIEEKLEKRLSIPVFHDDQHGTATIVLAALINALKLIGKRKENCSVLMLGAGAAGTAISKILLGFGIGDIVIYDSFGPIYSGRTEKMNKYKQELAQITNKKNQQSSLADGFKDKDIFIGVSRPNMITGQMIASMAKNAIVLPLSNPVGEITKEEAYKAGAAIAADGRDINNAQAYPGIFRGALDARATKITMAMKIAAAQKIADLTPQGQLVPDVLDRQIHRQIADAVAKAWKKDK